MLGPFFGQLFGIFSTDLAIDLGTANTIVYVKGQGIVLNEPSVVAVQRDMNGRLRVLAVGEDAKAMLGRTPGGIQALRPMRGGVVADADVAEAMLRKFMEKVVPSQWMMKPRVVLGVPYGINEVERKAVRDAALHAGAREVYLVDQPMAAALGAGLPVTEPTANVIVDIGGGTTDVACISLSGVVHGISLKVGGDNMDDAIVAHIERKHGLRVGVLTAERVKMEIGTVFPQGEMLYTEVSGFDIVNKAPRTVTIDSNDVLEALREPARAIVGAVRQLLENIPPALHGDLVHKGIVLAGGGALIGNLDQLMREEIGIPVMIAPDPLICVALGCGRSLDDINLLRNVSLKS